MRFRTILGIVWPWFLVSFFLCAAIDTFIRMIAR
jgi:hypothetical protein